MLQLQRALLDEKENPLLKGLTSKFNQQVGEIISQNDFEGLTTDF